jgi:hypothetical protein
LKFNLQYLATAAIKNNQKKALNTSQRESPLDISPAGVLRSLAHFKAVCGQQNCSTLSFPRVGDAESEILEDSLWDRSSVDAVEWNRRRIALESRVLLSEMNSEWINGLTNERSASHH